VRVVKPDRKERTRSGAEIFSGHVETLTAVGGEHSRDLRLSEVHFKDGARNRWHVHSTDQILLVTEGDGIVATEAERHDLTPGVVVLIPAETKHWHGAKPGRSMTHWSILGPASTRIVD
jgi:quercetin dioxygenase-like cupin family protein